MSSTRRTSERDELPFYRVTSSRREASFSTLVDPNLISSSISILIFSPLSLAYIYLRVFLFPSLSLSFSRHIFLPLQTRARDDPAGD